MLLSDAIKRKGLRHKARGSRSADTPWVYHATSESSLKGIRARGLQPRKPKKARQPRGVYFSPTRHHALSWNGPVVLRFPWPESWEDDAYGDMTIVDGDIVSTAMFTPDAIPVSVIEVLEQGRWVPLRPAVVATPTAR